MIVSLVVISINWSRVLDSSLFKIHSLLWPGTKRGGSLLEIVLGVSPLRHGRSRFTSHDVSFSEVPVRGLGLLYPLMEKGRLL
jgi:hypothetical protein